MDHLLLHELRTLRRERIRLAEAVRAKNEHITLLRERMAALQGFSADDGRDAAEATDTATDESLARRLIWILGSPRTGSSWLLRLLIHPLHLSRAKVGFRLPLLSHIPDGRVIVPLDEPYLPVHLTPLLVPPYRPGERILASDFLHNTRRVNDPSYFFSDEYADCWRPAVRGMILARFGAQIDRAARGYALIDPFVAVKEPNGSHGAELLMSLFPSSRLIFLMRDGRDVIESLVDAHVPGGWLERRGTSRRLDSPEQRAAYIRNHSRIWVQQMTAVRNAYSAHSPDLRLMLRYEDLLEEPVGQLRRVLAWLGVERSDEWIARALDATAGGKRAAQPGLWREALSDREQQIMAEVMHGTLVSLGYSD